MVLLVLYEIAQAPLGYPFVTSNHAVLALQWRKSHPSSFPSGDGGAIHFPGLRSQIHQLVQHVSTHLFLYATPLWIIPQIPSPDIFLFSVPPFFDSPETGRGSLFILTSLGLRSSPYMKCLIVPHRDLPLLFRKGLPCEPLDR